MRSVSRTVATAAVMTLAHAAAAVAEGPQTALAFYVEEQKPQLEGVAPPALSPAPDGDITGSIGKQIKSVAVGCLKPDLMRIVRSASSHFRSQAVITSGYRPGRGSYHGRCMAADVQIAGVASGTLARFFRAQPGVGGVGTYGHTRSVHVDIAPRKFSWHRGGRKRYSALGSGGCPCCASLNYGAGSAVQRSCTTRPVLADVKLGSARG